MIPSSPLLRRGWIVHRTIRCAAPSDSGWFPHWREAGRGFFKSLGELTMKKRISLKTLRYRAYQRQSGKCYYCGYPMWEGDSQGFAERYGLSSRQSRLLQATGEHLMPFSMGGPATRRNIVAACLHCNKTRHKNQSERSAEVYLHYVQARVNSGKWHSFQVAKQ